MRSIPLAMSWAIYKHSRWQLVVAILGANWLPVFLLFALSAHGPIDSAEPAYVTIQMIFVQLQIFAFGAALLMAHELTRRMFTMPVTNSMLVAGEMFPAMILMALQQLASTALLNATFQLNWPLLSPALFAAVAYAMVLAAMWISDKSPWQPVCFGIAGSIIGLWFKSRHGKMFSMPDHTWQTVTPSELITLAVFATVAYYLAVIGLARSRCGIVLSIPVNSIRLGGLLTNGRTALTSIGPRFATPARAQFWFEWREKGWKLPAIVVTALVTGIAIWVIFSREPKLLVEGLVFGGAIMAGVAWVGGLVVGNCGMSDSDMPMGQFRATRPLTDRDMARTILQTASGTVVISWAIWLVTFLIILGILIATGSAPEPLLPAAVKWWFFPASLLGSWTLAATMTVVCLTGHGQLCAKVIIPTLIAVVIDMMISIFVSPAVRAWIQSTTLVVLGAGIGLLALAVMVVARRRALIEDWQLAGAAIAWITLGTIIVVEASRMPTVKPPLIVMLVGLSAWVVAPLAAAPLAVAWNRHR